MSEHSALLNSQRLRVTVFDRTWCWLLALLILFGATAFFLSMIWLSNHMHTTEIARELNIEELGDGDGGGDGRPSGGTQLETPDQTEDIPIADSPMEEMNDALAAVSETVVDQVAMLDDPALQTPKVKGDYGTGGGSGGGNGPGRGMGHGKGRPGRPQRRELQFDKGNTIDTYGRQLDFFNIELAVRAPEDKLTFISNFKAKPPTRRDGPRSEVEGRYVFSKSLTDGMREADVEFFRRVKVNVPSSEVIYMIIPTKWVDEMARLEKTFQNKTPAEIKKTRFGIISDGGGYKFNVISQMLK